MPTTTTTTTTPFPLEVEVLLFESGIENSKVTKRRGAFNFGTIAPGETSKILVAQLKSLNTLAIGNIKIGLIDTGGITFAPNIFGLTSLFEIRSDINIDTYFQGVNTQKNSTSIYNISIDNLTNLKSNYIYLNINLPHNQTLENGVIRYAWFFDYAL